MRATVHRLARSAENKYLGLMAASTLVMMSTIDFAAAQTGSSADPKAPLTFQQTAQQAANSSRLNPESAKTGLESVASIFLYTASAFSLLFAGLSIWRWWDATNNEQSRHNAGRSFMAACVAAVLGIVGIFVGWVQSIGLGSGT